MAFKLLLLITLGALLADAAEINGAAPMIHVADVMTDEYGIYLVYLIGHATKSSRILRSGEEYEFKIENTSAKLDCTITRQLSSPTVGDVEFAEASIYDPIRDKGRAAIYWKADDIGVSFSYDNTNFNLSDTWSM